MDCTTTFPCIHVLESIPAGSSATYFVQSGTHASRHVEKGIQHLFTKRHANLSKRNNGETTRRNDTRNNRRTVAWLMTGPLEIVVALVVTYMSLMVTWI